MAGFSNIDWSRLGAEAIVIIASVLAALAVDDWRDARADRELEQYLLGSLQADLAADLEELEDARKADEAVERASNFLLGKPDMNAVEPESRPAAIRALARGTGDFDLSDITFQEMMSTGSFRVIRDTALRRKISHYYWLVRSFNITNATAEAYRSDFLKALLRNGVVPSAVDSESKMSVIENVEVRALVEQLGATGRGLNGVHGYLMEQAEQLSAAIGAELAE